ncbi:DUF3108 domain-containing protein [Roseococcus sp. YIM B11640]|uniref:DUF3108 domain-containing protein n=1 Tax=Roseococcus sp. YIM B11640 TaxID=3133973 RepID=UPI003C7A8D14
MLRSATLALLLAAGPASAEVWQAGYLFTAAGIPLMEAQVAFDMDRPGARYFVETRTRPRGLATIFFRGEQVARSEGAWRGSLPRPLQHRSQGNWRGTPRRTQIDYAADGTPRVTVLDPQQDMERTPIPTEALPGTLDSLSAMVQLARQVRETSRCDGRARIFDGRRLTELTVATDAVRQADSGGLPSCVIESRIVGGLPVERPEDARVMRSIVHFAPPREPGAPLLPIRIELPSRWWGTLQVTLVGLSRT